MADSGSGVEMISASTDLSVSELEVDLTDSGDDSSCGQAAPSVVQRTSPCVVTSLNQEDVEKQKKAHKNASNKVVRHKYWAKRRDSVSNANLNADEVLSLSLQGAISRENGRIQNYINPGDGYENKFALVHRCREAAEYLSLSIDFPVSSVEELRAVTGVMQGVDDDGFMLKAIFSMGRAM